MPIRGRNIQERTSNNNNDKSFTRDQTERSTHEPNFEMVVEKQKPLSDAHSRLREQLAAHRREDKELRGEVRKRQDLVNGISQFLDTLNEEELIGLIGENKMFSKDGVLSSKEELNKQSDLLDYLQQQKDILDGVKQTQQETGRYVQLLTSLVTGINPNQQQQKGSESTQYIQNLGQQRRQNRMLEVLERVEQQMQEERAIEELHRLKDIFCDA